MILRSIAVEGWKCFANRIEVATLGDGLNVLHGPNGAGKSTLLDAMIRGLFDTHTVGGEGIESRRPWGRPLAPVVTIVYEHQGETYVLAKRFLDSPSSELKRKEHGKLVRLAEGVAANQLVREMLLGETPGRGLTKPEHWGVAQVLWAPQNRLPLDTLSKSAAGAIQTALGAALGEGDAIQRRVEDAYRQIFTEAGKYRKGSGAPRIVALEAELDKAQDQRRELQSRLTSFEEAGRRVEDLKNRGSRAAFDSQEAEKTLEQERRRASLYATILAEKQKYEAETRAAEAQFSELKQRIEHLASHRQEMTALDRELERLGADLPFHAREVERCRLEEAAGKTRLEAIRGRQGEVTAASDLARDAARFREHSRRLGELDELLGQIAGAQARIDGLTEQRKAMSAPSPETVKAVRAAQRRRDQLRVQLDASLSNLSAHPEDGPLPSEPHDQRTALDRLLAEIAGTQQRLDARRKQRAAAPAPSAETVKAVRAAVSRRDQFQVQLDASLITLTVDPEADLTVEVLRAEDPGRREAAPGRPVQIKGSPEAALRIPGVGVFRATGPTGSADELRRQIAETDRQIDELTREFGVRDPDQLQSLHSAAAALDAEIKQADEALASLLAKSKKIEELRRQIAETDRQIDALTEGLPTRDADELQSLQGRADGLDAQIKQAADALRTLLLKGRTSEDIRQERDGAAATVEELLRRYPEWKRSPPDPDALEARAKAVDAAFVREVRQAEDHWRVAFQAVAQASQALARHETSIAEQQKRLTELRNRVAALSSDGRDDAQRAAELKSLAIRCETARARLEDLDGKLKEFGADPGRQVQILQAKLEHLQKDATECRDRANLEQGRLNELAAAAPYSALAEVEETIGRLQAEIARERLHNEAIRVLRDTIRRHRTMTLEALLGPVRKRATQTLHRIAGTRLGDIAFSDGFLAETVSPREAASPVKIDDLCGGEQEQIHFAVRLALADVLFQKERQLLVLDDVLTCTDAGRLARVLAVLEESAARFQVLVLTCHPERYAGLAGACFFDLERLAERS